MKFFVDTADTEEIRELCDTGLLDGVTTNPSLVAKTGRNFFEVLAEICALVPGPVSAEVAATDVDGMLAEARRLIAIADNVTVKVPLTWDGLKACRALTQGGAKVNVTLCFSAAQAILAAKAGATFVSPFVGRLDDIGHDGMALIADIRRIYDNYNGRRNASGQRNTNGLFRTEILVASIRHPMHVVEAARIGADVATLPPKVLRQLAGHALTDKGLAAFLADWEKTGQTIVKD